MALSTGVEDMFAHESWEPPDPELRKLRKDFYGPLTAELLRHSMAGALAEEEAKTARQAASKARAKGRWTAANSKVKGIGKALHEMQELTLERWFITWQEKNVVSVVPPSASTGDGHSSGGEEKAVAEDLDVMLRAAEEARSRQSLGTPAEVGSRPGAGRDHLRHSTAPRSSAAPSRPATVPRTAGAEPSSPSAPPTRAGLVSGGSGVLFAAHERPLPVGCRLFCFPWEGGGANIFEPLSWAVPSAQLVAIAPPGRAHRCREPSKARAPCARSAKPGEEKQRPLLPLLFFFFL